MEVNLTGNISPPKPKVGLVMSRDVTRLLTLAIPFTGQWPLRHGGPANGLGRRCHGQFYLQRHECEFPIAALTSSHKLSAVPRVKSLTYFISPNPQDNPCR